MDAREILNGKNEAVITVRLGALLQEVVRALSDYNIGVVLVTDASGKLAGIVSERDFIRGLQTFGPGLMDTPVDALLTANVITCAPDDNIVDIVRSMDTNGIRHLPVVDGGDVIGMISIRDIMGTWFDASEDEIKQLRKLVAA